FNKSVILHMKLTALLLTALCTQAWADALSQHVTLYERNASLEQVLHSIRRQSGYQLIYNSDYVLDTKPVFIRLRNATVHEALDKALAGQPLTYEIEDNTILIDRLYPSLLAEASPRARAQRVIRGRVTDPSGMAIEGVSVLEKGTTNGTATDSQGDFSITVQNESSVLVFRLIGFVTQEIAASANSFNVTLLSDETAIDEVVVVGYGTQRKVNLTGAVTQIGGEELEGRPITRVSQALQGMVGNLNITSTTAGGAPNATQSINIRGSSVFGTAGGPLIVIDGIQGGSINNLNADDIESISVVKDAASAAIYGSSAPYGVILVTTKQGKKGAKPYITYSNNLQWAAPINLPKMVNSLDFANLFNEAAANAGRGNIYSEATLQRIRDYQAGTFMDETVQNGFPDNLTDGWASWGGGNANNDWFDIYYKDVAYSQQHNLGVRGGSENSQYYVGLGYNDRNGMYNFGDDSYQRFNVRANLGTDISEWLTFNFRSSMSRELFDTPNTYSGKTGGNYMHQIARKWPTVPLFNPDGLYSDASDVRLHLEGGRNKQVTDNAVLTGEFNLRLAEGWTASANYTFNGTFWKQDFHTRTVYAYRPSGAQYIMTGDPNGYHRGSDRTQYQVVNAFTQYEKSIDGHYFSLLGGYVSDLREYETYTASNSQLYSDNIPSLATAYGTSPSVNDAARTLATQGFFGRINYNFNEKCLLELNGRYDATSRFLTDVRWKFYPGVSAGWNVDKESFFEGIKPTVSAFKLRGSYGSLGDQAFLDGDSPNWYPFYPSLGTSRPTSTNWLFGGAQQAAVSPPGLVNPDLTWVTTTQLNLGADLGFFSNRLLTTFDWYIRKAEDFATTGAALPALLGTGVPVENNAGTETRGFELSLAWRAAAGNITYGVRGILSDYRGKVTAFANNPVNNTDTYYVGREQGEIWGYTTVGLFQNEAEIERAASQERLSGAQWKPGDVHYADINGDGIIDWGNNTLENPGDRRIIGNSTPRFAYSLTGDVQWKGFDASIFLQGIGKRDVWIGSNYFWGINGDEWQSSVFDVHLDRWTPETPNGYFPRYYLNGEMGKNMNAQTRYLQNAAYLRIKNLQVGYSLPKTLLNSIKFDKVRLYVSIENLATFTKLIKTMDPELSISDAKIYPLQRFYSFGINVGF
ncbi:MAG: SusC/RagA family TonB-linked outer membrane protein, partial [Parapedobacter sp.]